MDYILSPELKEKWDRIDDDSTLTVDISIACAVKIPSEPALNKNESEEEYAAHYENWLVRKKNIELQKDELENQRQTDLGHFLSELDAVIISDFVGYSDSFGCRVELSGKALKDFVFNYQYLFDVTEYDAYKFTSSISGDEININATIIPPDANCPKICIIDSGVQGNHRLLRAGIDSSKCYIPGELSTVDEAPNGGHGTKVAGAVLYGGNIPKRGPHKLDIWICNARVLNDRNELPKELFPPRLMEEVVSDFSDCKVFNLSINAKRSSKIIHMSQWAAIIDKLMAAQDKLFIISTGNISTLTRNHRNPGIKEHIAARRSYPEYLLTPSARIADPSQSCFAITVGSVCSNSYDDDDKKSFGIIDEPSAFTRTGPGLWRMIKPDVVEYGGDYIREKVANPNISQLPETSSEVIRTTAMGGNAIGYDVGTSYAAPKVSHIAGKILNNFPDASANLIRALIVQSARLPGEKHRTPRVSDMWVYGYGIPNMSRATENTESRITLIAEGKIHAKEAQIYTIKLPDEIRRAGNEYDILIEVTLAFTATPRRTRRRTNSYLSTWVDWHSSKFDETYRQFRNRITKFIDGDSSESFTNNSDNDDYIKWNIRENIGWGNVKGLRRQDSSLQKDWTILKAYSLPKEFSIAVAGHKGWEKDIFRDVPFALTVSFEILNAEIDIYNLVRIENEIEIEINAI